jgi:hypothetical protein
MIGLEMAYRLLAEHWSSLQLVAVRFVSTAGARRIAACGVGPLPVRRTHDATLHPLRPERAPTKVRVVGGRSVQPMQRAARPLRREVASDEDLRGAVCDVFRDEF